MKCSYNATGTKKSDNSIKKLAKDWNRYFHKEDIQVANKAPEKGLSIISQWNVNQDQRDTTSFPLECLYQKHKAIISLTHGI